MTEYWLLLRIFTLCLMLPGVASYFIGEHVDTTIYSPQGRSQATTAQRPLFGFDSSVQFPRKTGQLSLGFEEGFHQLPWIDVTSLGKVRVSFLYSKSGDGAIHSVSSEPVMKSKHEEYSHQNLAIEYVWVEEEPIDLQSGAIVMFLTTLIVSVIFLLQTCGLADSDDDGDYTSHSDPNESKRG